MTESASILPRTAREILGIFKALRLDDVARHFDTDEEDIDPYVVCDRVSVDAFNAYVGDGEGLRVALRFLDLTDDGRLLILELPTIVHESTVEEFKGEFLDATGNRREVAKRGSMTASIAALPKKEADATYGPMGSTPNQTAPPAPRTIADWVTLAVEVGRSQSWAALTRAVNWWCQYAGIQYILVMKVSASGRQMRYALYDIAILGNLPMPTASGTFRRRANNPPAVEVQFDMHRILSIPAHQALPAGVNQVAVVDLRTVLDLVVRCLR
ncbi:hypothetical protein DYB32_009732 [Aphanomyces invadans]|uniref:Uncharacterized protein n=1 Tax=Aphanomyces invadans TaxID=157072 RepID=A0A3R6YS46_9STRA|nr:hypothetical protein DYB32_009732 [Aphanomyces invadans]